MLFFVSVNRHASIAIRTMTMGAFLAGFTSMVLLGSSPALAWQAPIATEELEDLAANQAPQAAPASEVAPDKGINVLNLLWLGGPLMIPIGLMSLLVVTLAVERFVGLRSGRVVPKKLVRELENNARRPEAFDPQNAWQSCERYPSAAGRVIQAMLQRCGRPVADIEQAAAETAQREADRLSSPIRWLTLAAALTPLLGLFGTVWGMVLCFHQLTEIPAGQNKAEMLAEGIYTALVTTVGGLAVAIPATVFAYWFEGRVMKLMRRTEELAFRIAPGLERFTGRMRMDLEGQLCSLSGPPSSPPVKAPPVLAAPVRSK